MKDLIVLKIGGSVLTDKFSKVPKVDFGNLKRISREISSAYNPKKISLILIHGVGSYGHIIVRETHIDKGIKREQQLEAFAKTQRLQNELNCIVTKYLNNENLPAIPCQASASAIMRSGRLIEMETSVIGGLLRMKMVPVLYGVPAYDIRQKCSILSGDQIVAFLAKRMKAKKIIHGTDVDGIFTEDPKTNSRAKLIPKIDSGNINQIKKWLKGSTAIDVTGGMLGKISELLNCGVETQIINALIPGNIIKALKGKRFGTLIRIT